MYAPCQYVLLKEWVVILLPGVFRHIYIDFFI